MITNPVSFSFWSISALLMLSILVVTALATSTTMRAYAQTSPPAAEELFPEAAESDRQAVERYYNLINPSQQARQIINTTQQECETANFIGNACVMLEYESPNTVILSGDKLLLDISTIVSATGSNYWSNPFLWRAVDDFKGLGYSVTSVELGGQGSKGNPHDITVVMEK